MAGYSERWYYQEAIDRYEKLEKNGRLGSKSRRILEYWRKAKRVYPNLVSISVVNGKLGISNPGE